MLTQEEYTDVLALRRHGSTIAEIATETRSHPATILKWLTAGPEEAADQKRRP